MFIIVRIRLFQPEDTEQIAQLFHDTVRQINIQDYSQEQIVAWSPEDIYFRNWLEICSSRFTYIAEEEKIIGFGELEANGHIDCFYVHYQHQHQGVGKKLYQAIENKAKALNLTSLFVEASITAKPFFARQGFTVVKQQQVFRREQIFINYAMHKSLIN